MKKNYLLQVSSSFTLLLLAVLLFFSACKNDFASEEVELDQVQQSQTEMLYQQLLTADDFESKKLIHASLTSAEKKDFWMHHVDVLIEKGNYSPAQVEHLLKTKKFFDDIYSTIIHNDTPGATPDPIDPCAASSDFFNNTPSDIFSVDEYRSLFVLSKIGDTRHQLTETEAELLCDCHTTNADCSDNRKCARIDCTGTFGGCGEGGLCDCRGRCWIG